MAYAARRKEGGMSIMRRRLLMSSKIEEQIVWDYEWYAPDEVPSWFSVGTNATSEMGVDYLRVYNPSAPSNYVFKNIMNFKASEFPAGSYIVEIDMVEMVARQATSAQGALIFSLSTSGNASNPGNKIWIGRLNTKMSGTDFYRCCLTTSTTDTNIIIPDTLRYKVRLRINESDSVIKVGSAQLTTSGVGAPRGIYGRYSSKGYLDIYSIKVKKIETNNN